MSEFKIYGPYALPTEKKKGARLIVHSGFWNGGGYLEMLSAARGVYVFAIKPPGASRFIPYYVGKATKSFGQEALTNDKLLKYQRALANYSYGSPHLFFVAQSSNKWSAKEIKEVEDYFIQQGFAVNPKTENDKGTKLPSWSVKGAIRGSKGKVSRGTSAFRSTFGLG